MLSSGPTAAAASSSDLSPVSDPVSLKKSFAYQWRIAISSTSLGLSVALACWFHPLRMFPLTDHVGSWGTGLILLAAGIAVRLWAASCLGGRKSASLVRVGPYSLCRNPLYVGTLLIALSQPFFFESGWILAGLIVPLLIYAYGVVPAEEQKLRVRLGEPYIQYCREVPRWWPRFTQFTADRSLWGLHSESFKLEVQRSACWLCLPLLPAALTVLPLLRL
jgi:protein-S-isoprenylcysteine O-methyltransferase Ste14